jgi:hypothetical protein
MLNVQQRMFNFEQAELNDVNFFGNKSKGYGFLKT